MRTWASDDSFLPHLPTGNKANGRIRRRQRGDQTETIRQDDRLTLGVGGYLACATGSISETVRHQDALGLARARAPDWGKDGQAVTMDTRENGTEC